MARKVKAINTEQKYCSPRQAGRVMGVSEYLVYKLYHDGGIPGARALGDRILVPVEWVTGTGTNDSHTAV